MISDCNDKPAGDKRSSRKKVMLEEEKTDSESSCLLFEKEKRLSERRNYVCRKYTLRSFTGKGKQAPDDKAYFPPIA